MSTCQLHDGQMAYGRDVSMNHSLTKLPNLGSIREFPFGTFLWYFFIYVNTCVWFSIYRSNGELVKGNVNLMDWFGTVTCDKGVAITSIHHYVTARSILCHYQVNINIVTMNELFCLFISKYKNHHAMCYVYIFHEFKTRQMTNDTYLECDVCQYPS